MCRPEGFNEFVQIPLQDAIQLVQGQSDPVVRHSILGEVVRPNPLAAVSRPHLGATLLAALTVCFELGPLEQPRLEDLHGPGPVLVLGLLILAAHHDSRRKVREAHSRLDTRIRRGKP